MAMKIYTKTGDKGETSLFGGKRVPKDNIRINAYGTVDELNAILGIALTETEDEDLTKTLVKIQHILFIVGGDLATPNDQSGEKVKIERLSDGTISDLERIIDTYENALEPLKQFILPGGSKAAAQLHFARTVCRRAERECITLSQNEQMNQNIIIFLNRLSDLLFVLARYANLVEGHEDVFWKK